VIVDLTLETEGGQAPLRFACARMFNAGYTGRNQAEVRKHIEELALKGIPGPPETPTLYPVIRSALVADPVIEVYGRGTCGEVEYVLLMEDERRVYVGVGSDHTDRTLEEHDIPRAKQICPNVIGRTVWPLGEVESHWDSLILRARQKADGQDVLYQEGVLGRLMAPRELMAFVRSKSRAPLEGTVIFSGTLAALTGGFVYGDRFAAEIVDPRRNRRLTLGYDVCVLDAIS
jgi:hypothetical protein